MNKYGALLIVNGAEVTAGRPVRVHPGLANDVTVVLERSAPQALARLRILTADGRKREERAGFVDGNATLKVGPMAAPAQYDFEAGVVYRRGYRLVVTVMQGEEERARFSLGAVCSQDPDAEWLMLDAPERVVFNDGHIVSGEIWDPFHGGARAMDPPVLLCLGHRVLLDPDAVEVRFHLRPDSPELNPLRARLLASSADGDPMSDDRFVNVGPDWQSVAMDVSQWPEGDYRIELHPELEEKVFADGPIVTYRRRRHEPLQVRVSPFAPYAFETDPGRKAVQITEWPKVLPAGWRIKETPDGPALFTDGDRTSKPVELAPDLEGWYAVFVLAVGSIHLSLADHDFVRRVHEPERPEYEEVFAAAIDLTGQSIQLYPNDAKTLRDLTDDEVDIPPSGIRRIRFVPVTRQSVDTFRRDTSQLPYELRAVDDWWCYFCGWDRHELDQLDAIMLGQRELGIITLDWAIGRSWVQYRSNLPDAQLFPCVPITPEAVKSDSELAGLERMVGDFDAYGYPLSQREDYGVRIHAWLAMNRHYDPGTHGGVFSSPWVRAHPEWNQFTKSGSRDTSRVEYFFPEVRTERLDILEEAARYGPDGIVIGCCRQPPMAGYNPQMVEQYKQRTGVDPRQIDVNDGQPYQDWIQWRSGYFTEFLRELRERLTDVQSDTGRTIPVIARIPAGSLQLNMAQGIDVRAWVEDGLIDELQLDPLQSFAEGGSHDVRPYVELCGRQGLRVLGGVNGTSGAGWSDATEPDEGILLDQASAVVGIRRAIGLIDAGVDGIEIYEAEVFARACERRWLIPLWGDVERARAWLNESNLEAVFPVMASNACQGHDNHWFGGETMRGAQGLPRGATRAL